MGPRRSGIRCCAINCLKTSRKHATQSFFRFPKDPERCKRWVINSRRADLMKKDAAFLNNCFRLCADHFEDMMFTNIHKNRLNWNAVPTIFDVPNPPKRVASKRRPPKERHIAPTSASRNPVPVIKTEERRRSLHKISTVLIKDVPVSNTVNKLSAQPCLKQQVDAERSDHVSHTVNDCGTTPKPVQSSLTPFKDTHAVSWIVENLVETCNASVDLKRIVEENHPSVDVTCFSAIVEYFFPSCQKETCSDIEKQHCMFGISMVTEESSSDEKLLTCKQILDCLLPGTTLLDPAKLEFGFPSDAVVNGQPLLKMVSLCEETNTWTLRVHDRLVDLAQLGISNHWSRTHESVARIVKIVNKIRVCYGHETSDRNHQSLRSSTLVEQLIVAGCESMVHRSPKCEGATQWFQRCCTQCQPHLLYMSNFEVMLSWKPAPVEDLVCVYPAVVRKGDLRMRKNTVCEPDLLDRVTSQDLHEKLLRAFDFHLDTDEFIRLREVCRPWIGLSELLNIRTAYDLLIQLQQKGVLNVGKYGEVIKLLDLLRLSHLKDMVEECIEKFGSCDDGNDQSSIGYNGLEYSVTGDVVTEEGVNIAVLNTLMADQERQSPCELDVVIGSQSNVDVVIGNQSNVVGVIGNQSNGL